MGVHGSKGTKGAKDLHYLGVNNPPPPLAITANGRMRLGSFKRGVAKKHGRSTSPNSDVSTNSALSHAPPAHRVSVISPAHRVTTGVSPAHRATGVSPAHRATGGSPAHRATGGPPAQAEQNGGNRPGTAPLFQQKNGTAAGHVPDMKTPLARKQPPRRSEKHKIVQNHNRLASGNKPPAALGAAPGHHDAPVPTLAPVAAPEAPHPSVKALEAAESALKRLQDDHKKYIVGFDAMTVLVNYLVVDYDALSTPLLASALATLRAENNEQLLVLDEMAAQMRRLNEKHEAEVDELRKTHKQELEAIKDEAALKYNELDVQYKTENNNLAARLSEQNAKVEAEYQQRLDEVQMRHDDLETVCSGLRSKERQLIESLKLDKDTRLQATAARCKELQDEVNSLATVLELRHGEMQELRHKNALLRQDSEELPVAQKKASALQARVEDLEVQLKIKKDKERKLTIECMKMSESFTQESVTSKRLTLANEELKWKLMHSVRPKVGKVSHSNTSLCCPESAMPDCVELSTRSLPDPTSDYRRPPACSNILQRSDSLSYTLHVDDASPKWASARSSPTWSPKTSASRKRGGAATLDKTRYAGMCDEPAGAWRYVADAREADPTRENVPPCEFSAAMLLEPVAETRSGGFNRVSSRSLCGNTSTPNSRDGHPAVSELDTNDFCRVLDASMSVSSSSSSSNDVDVKEGEELEKRAALSCSSELAFAATQFTVLKESAGEAMVSEETSEEENLNQLSDEESSSEIQ